ncbi:MAG: SUMF1/EgtB/PvdO family nonheme iron enzyme [Xanthobacteraceae bacterium]|jgi:formylglycine-generating enzyme required for sulfatase activity
MRRWFLSYNSQDLALIQAFEAALRRKDTEARIFFASKSLRAGGYWLPEIAKEIAEATAFVLLVGEKGLGPWQVTEYYEALDRRVKEANFPIVFVLLDGQSAPGLPFLRQLHWIITPDPASEKCLAMVIDAAAGDGGPPGDLWRHTAPYRGLAAMTEADSDFFFGRGRETVDVLSALAGAPDRLPVLIGNSGVGKSSLAQAGVLAALKRQAWPEEAGAPNAWPQAFEDSRQWCFLTLKPGTEPLKALADTFLDTWQFAATDPERVKQQNGWVELLRDGKATLRDLVDATARRHNELDQPEPPAFFLYIDQGEELYVRAEERQRQRFSEILAHALPDPRVRSMMSMRSDFLGGLQNDEPLFNAHRQINVPPLREAELRKVVSRPAELLSARFETPGLVDIITRRTAEDSVNDVGALPLLSYTLDDMWTQMVKGGDGVLRLPAQSFELGGVLVDRANTFLAAHPDSEDALRRVLTLRLATVHEDGEPTRRRAPRSEFSAGEWRLVSELADHPNRLLVTVTAESGETYAEVAHEAIFRRWNKLRDWIAAEREFLAWRSGLEAARRAWQAIPPHSKDDALLMGHGLAQASNWLAKRAEDISPVDREFVVRSRKVAQRRKLRLQALIYLLFVGIITGLIGWINQSYLKEQINWFMTMRPYRVANFDPHVFKPEAERALKPQASFRECAKDCPEMIVVPAGTFTMGSPPTEQGRFDHEGPQHTVTIAKPFAVSKFDVTFADWDACVSVAGCPKIPDGGFGRDTKPVINVNFDEAQQYVAWLSKMTGQPYRLLTEAEWEYAARAGSTTAYYWGVEIGRGNANCNECGSRWDNLQTSPVGSFAANQFGLYDMAGNVWQWVQDCYHDDYNGAPTDGSAWTSGDCGRRVIRGGSWYSIPQFLRAANGDRLNPGNRDNGLGFRVGRTLTP